MRTAIIILIGFIFLISFQELTEAVSHTTITVHKFKDDNRNGVQDSGENSLSNWAMVLFSGPGCRSILAEDRTDGNGNGVFGESPGTFSVGERFQQGRECTTGRCQHITVHHHPV